MRPLPSTTPDPAACRSACPCEIPDHGAVEFDDITLLSLLMARTMAEREIAGAAEALLDVFGSAAAVVAAEPCELARVAPLGAATITDLKLLRRLSVRLARSEACRRPVLSSWSALLGYVRAALAHEPREQFRTLYLDRKNLLLRDEFQAEESAYRAQACSPVGACGLTQLMPATALELGVKDRFDPVENLKGGADYLARQIVTFRDLRLALAAYNSGPTRVARLGRVPDIAETRAYVASVLECYLALSAGRAVTTARQCLTAEVRP